MMPSTTHTAILLAAALLTAAACGDDDYAAELTSIEPANAYVGQEVQLKGTLLGENGDASIVLTTFDGLTEFDLSEAATAWSDTTIAFTVPPGLEERAFVINLEQGGQRSNRLRLDIVLPPDPALTLVSPPAGEYGDSLTLTGTHFGDTQGSIVFWPEELGKVTAWSDTQIVVEVPDISESESLRVERADGFLSTWFPFSVADPSVPTLSLIQDTIFTPRCTSGPCHGTFESGDMSLMQGTAFDNLVAVESRLSGVLRVTPFQPDSSLLIQKLENQAPAIGEQMPLNAAPLEQEQIDLIRAWILQGAQNN